MLTRFGLAVLLPFWPGATLAHSFAQPYQLPVPYWMYIFAAIAALVLSFFVVVWFFVASDAKYQSAQLDFGDSPFVAWARRIRLLGLVQCLSLLLLVLCIATGLWGTQNAFRNFNMSFFWILFVLGFSYCTAVVGNWYAVISPWVVLSKALGQRFCDGRVCYAKRLGYWPAVALYMTFIWIELLGHNKPFSLSVLLLSYTGLNLLGVWLIGARDWFRYCEFFAVFMRLLAKMAPLRYLPEEWGAKRLSLRWPFVGLLDEPAEHFSLLVFILFMLSSTAYDGLSETIVWFNLFWKDTTGILTSLLGQAPLFAYAELRPWYFLYETMWIIASPFLYLVVYLAFVWVGKQLAGSRYSVYELAMRFAYSLLPIVLVYHFTHYYTLLITQGLKLRGLISDPFGWGWNLFGTAEAMRINTIPDMGVVWNTQVWLILLGHVLSVYLAHIVALQTFSTRRQAMLSQAPMLLLMVLFTVVGLWILAQPLQGR